MALTPLSTGIVTLVFLAYLYLTEAGFVQKKLSSKMSADAAQTRQILFNRFLGFFLFGIIPLMVISLSYSLNTAQLGLGFEISGRIAFITAGLVVIPVIVNFFAAQSADNLAMYPQIRTLSWSKPLVFISALSWMMYLLGYETMLRGVLFYSCLQEMSLWSAIMINTSIYALIHIPKGIKETLGSIPMGIILCVLTFYSGTIWPAFLVHCALALSNEWFSMKYNKDLKIL